MIHTFPPSKILGQVLLSPHCQYNCRLKYTLPMGNTLDPKARWWQNLHMNSFFVITGGPGSGKTTLIDALVKAGFHCAQESAREIIQEGKAKGKDPVSDLKQLGRDMIKTDIRLYEAVQQDGKPSFFDKSLVDSLMFLKFYQGIEDDEISELTEKYRYNKTAFITPPWPEIYVKDEERTGSSEESIQIYQALQTWYVQSGYQLVEIPKLPVEQRVQFVIERAHMELP